MQGFSTFKLRSVWVSLQKYDIHSSWQYLSTPVLCARHHVRPGYTVVMRCPWRHESVMKLSCNTVVGCHQTNTPSCMYSTQMHLLDTLLLFYTVCLAGGEEEGIYEPRGKITPNTVGNRDQIRKRKGGTDTRKGKLEWGSQVRLNHLVRSGEICYFCSIHV